MANVKGQPLAVWTRVADALGIAGANAGERRAIPQPDAMTGTVEQVHQDGRQKIVVMHLDAPGPGAAMFGCYDAGADVTARIDASSSPEWNVLGEHEISEVMTRAPLTTLPPTAGVEWAADIMRRQRIHRVLITEGDALVGIVSALDIVTAVADHRLTARQFVFQR